MLIQLSFGQFHRVIDGGDSIASGVQGRVKVTAQDQVIHGTHVGHDRKPALVVVPDLQF